MFKCWQNMSKLTNQKGIPAPGIYPERPFHVKFVHRRSFASSRRDFSYFFARCFPRLRKPKQKNWTPGRGDYRLTDSSTHWMTIIPQFWKVHKIAHHIDLYQNKCALEIKHVKRKWEFRTKNCVISMTRALLLSRKPNDRPEGIC